MKFNTDCSPIEILLGLYFYKGFKPFIKLWNNEKGWEQLDWDDLVKKSIKTKAKTKIQASNNWDLDYQCPQGKQPLKLMNKEQQK